MEQILEKAEIAQLAKPTERIGSTGRHILEHSARTAVTAVASMLAARFLSLPHGGWSSSGGDHSNLFWATRACIQCKRLSIRAILCGSARRSQCLSVWRSHAGNRVARSTHGTCMASCFASIRRSVHRHRSSTCNDGSMAREGFEQGSMRSAQTP